MQAPSPAQKARPGATASLSEQNQDDRDDGYRVNGCAYGLGQN